ncbi:MAG: hypothetical protein LBL75_01065 [Rickettsiales bacterium]|jgi:myo-inositol-1(or 4)-monophosphatase|nr:hypothetical protein [Rickettsiales bacterium]
MTDAPENLLKGSVELNKMFAAVAKTGAGLRRDFIEVENLQQSITGARDFVRRAAVRIEESILRDLVFVRPNAGVLTPNYSADGDGRDEFVLALSGAENFVRGNSHFAISLALRSGGETKIAIIYNPIEDKLFYGEQDNGAFIFSAFHSARVGVSRIADSASALIGLDNTVNATRRGESYRVSGCVALDLAFVASGKFDGFVGAATDYAQVCAGELLINLAGGTFEMDADLIATNGKWSVGE